MSDKTQTIDIVLRRRGPTRRQDVITDRMSVSAECHGLLAVHRNVAGTKWRRGGWNVTHIPTGHAILTCRTKREARQFCKRILPLADWAAIRPGPLPAEIRESVLQAMREVWEAETYGADQQAPADAAAVDGMTS